VTSTTVPATTVPATTVPATTVPATTVPSTTVPTTTAGAPSTTTTPALAPTSPLRARKSPGGSLSGGAILAAVLGGLLILAVLTWSVFRWGAFEPHWLLTLRHSIAEASFRLSATWAELVDWARIGR
jgi:hypothetical protein